MIEALRSWLREAALPFWASVGVEAGGAFVEHLTLDAQDARATYRRTRVLARQVYVFSHAAELGLADSGAVADAGARYLIDRAWLGDAAGWARRLDREGRPLDRTPDLYDLAFVLFALAWRRRVAVDPREKAEAADLSRRTLDFLERAMRHPGGEGFLAEKPAVGWRVQNPHMHLLEAALAQLEVGGEPEWAALAAELVDLFERRFHDAPTGALFEYFDEAWARAPGPEGDVVEPGHLFEWAWILWRDGALRGVDHRAAIRRLIAFAEAHGVDRATGRVVDRVDGDGLATARSVRLWPACERIRGAVAAFEVDGRDPRAVFAESGGALWRDHLGPAPRGTWIDHLDADGAPMVDKIPTSSLYHLFGAIAEMARVAPRLPDAASAPRREPLSEALPA